MRHRGTETDFELTTIERLEQQGYDFCPGPDIDRDHDEVVFRDVLWGNLAERYSTLPATAIDEAVARISRPEGVDTLRRNLAFHQLLVRGFELPYELPDGRREFAHIYPINWDDLDANDFRVVNQLPVHGQNDRRPDLVIYINGLPLALFELKNPWDQNPTVEQAYNQVQHYRYEIPQLFDYNALVVVSDGVTTLHGMWPAMMEWYAPWKSIDGFDIEPNTTGSMKTLVEGLFQRDRLLEYLRHFIVFETANERIVKKGAKYHQFFAVRLANRRTLDAYERKEKRVGVIWHTTGSGKSLSMVFLVGILRREASLNNPTFVIQVDRTDLDDQLHDQFVAARTLVGDVKHADSVDDLRKLVQTEGGEIIFTTIEKFRLKTGPKGELLEIEHPVLSTRSNIVVIADEAHRSQYGFLKGYARYLADALPNASRLGFTGTPISFSGADTAEVFGELIHTYDIRQSQEDKATVPIYYAPRQIKLHLNTRDVDAELQEILDAQPASGVQPVVDNVERKKAQWSALAKAAGSKDRVEELAKDLLTHFLDRTATLPGKAMVVCMTRANCVRLYDALTSLSGSPEVKVVMTGNLGEDPPEWSAAGHLTTKQQRDTIKQRMIDPDDPLKMVIVCDMWLTGTDIPCLHTLYIDKPMRGHTMIQAISRVNRVFRDKPHGLIVDYIGIGDELREATAKYSQGGGRGEPAPDIETTARPMFFQCMEAMQEVLPVGRDYGGWRAFSRIELEDLYSFVFGMMADDDDLRDAFLDAEARLSSAFLLVKHLDDCRVHADLVIFCQRVRNQIIRSMPGRRPAREVERAVRDLVDDTVESEGVVDIFQAAGIERADIAILDNQFLQTFKNKPLENLRLKLLEKLMHDEIESRLRTNAAQAKSFRDMLEETLKKYHNRLIDAAAVIDALVRMRREMQSQDQRAAALGLDTEELTFYDAVAANYATIYDEQFLCALIHDVVQTIRKNLKVDWTEPHRDEVKAEIRSAVKRVLRKRNVRQEDLLPLVEKLIEQAEAVFAEWPQAA
jgi:type I restriction enzyme R subunit